MSNQVGLLELLQFCEQHEIAVTFWYHKGHYITGVPRYAGFNIDVGQMFEVDGRSMALHDFRSLVISNPDNHTVQERNHAAPSH